MKLEKITPSDQKKISIMKDKIAKITKTNSNAATFSNLSLKNAKFDPIDQVDNIMNLVNDAIARGKLIVNVKVPNTVRKAVIEKFKSKGCIIIANKDDISSLWITWIGSDRYFYMKEGGKSKIKPTPEIRSKEIRDYITRESKIAIEKQLWVNPLTIGTELFPSNDKLDKIAKKWK